jgi:hypothetical protein
MDSRAFVETRRKRCLAQTLEEFERRIESPLQALAPCDPRIAAIVADIEPVKRLFRKKIQALASDCLDLMPSDLEINAVELVRRGA